MLYGERCIEIGFWTFITQQFFLEQGTTKNQFLRANI